MAMIMYFIYACVHVCVCVRVCALLFSFSWLACRRWSRTISWLTLPGKVLARKSASRRPHGTDGAVKDVVVLTASDLQGTQLWVLDMWASHLLGPHVIDTKAGTLRHRSIVHLQVHIAVPISVAYEQMFGRVSTTAISPSLHHPEVLFPATLSCGVSRTLST